MNKKPDNTQLQNYLAIIAIVPAVLSIMACEFLDYVLHIIRPERMDYDPITGLGILIPMALMMELFTFFFSKRLVKKVNRITDAINQVGNGDYSASIDERHMAPFTEVVTNLNTMTQELQSVETLRADFINDFSHEFKTPITSINGFATLLLDTEVDDKTRNEYLKIIADESERLSHLAEQTILMSRLDSQTSIPDKVLFSLDEQIKQDIILLSNNWTSKNIDMDIDLASVKYYGNPSMMAHIWINLLTNAIKFTPEHGTIRIRCYKEQDNIICSISDTGKGMTREEQQRIFNRYYQSDKSHATQGLGLGLSIVHRIIELCNGSISVTSTTGSGSTFTVTLPIKNVEN